MSKLLPLITKPVLARGDGMNACDVVRRKTTNKTNPWTIRPCFFIKPKTKPLSFLFLNTPSCIIDIRDWFSHCSFVSYSTIPFCDGIRWRCLLSYLLHHFLLLSCCGCLTTFSRINIVLSKLTVMLAFLASFVLAKVLELEALLSSSGSCILMLQSKIQVSQECELHM
jgi:hypothetical protein